MYVAHAEIPKQFLLAHADPRESSRPLPAYPARTRATITRIGTDTPGITQHLATLGLLPNVEIEIENHAPFNGPVLVRVGRAHYALGREIANRIWVHVA